ncbi:hypothetical protein [Cytobacillus firmus]
MVIAILETQENAGILQGLLRTPVFAAILKFREKTLMNKIVSLLNTHLFNVKEVSEHGFAKINSGEVLKVVQESEKVRQPGN